MSKSGFFWNDKKSKISLIIEQRLKNTSSKPIMTKEVSRNLMELSSLSEEKLIILLQVMNNFDEINNFFMNNYWNKIGIFVKLMRKVCMRWKNGSEFKSHESMNLREEDWSKIEILSLNSQPRFRNYRMILIVWMIREISRCWISTQWTIPRSQSTCVFPTSSRSLWNAKPCSGTAKPQPWAAKYWGHTWFFGKSFCKSNGVFFSTLSARVEPMDL